MNTAAQTAAQELRTQATFRKSSRSSGSQDCVAAGRAGELAGFQDTKDPSRTTLAFSTPLVDRFLHAIKNGQYDL